MVSGRDVDADSSRIQVQLQTTESRVGDGSIRGLKSSSNLKDTT